MDAVAYEEDEGRTNINNLPPAILHGVFAWLGPRDLCAVSCTCILWRRLNRDHVSNSLWKKFYTSKWSVAPPVGDGVCWQSKYGSKMKQGKCWTGKYEHDSLYGHKAGVKALKLLPSHGMLVTGSLDRTVRLWDLKYGMPLSISRAHGGTVRSVALDSQLVVSGSSDNVVRLWHARNSTNGCSDLDPVAGNACLQDSIAGTAAAGAVGVLGLSEELLHLMEMDGPADLDTNQIVAAAAAATAAAAGAGSSSISLGFPGGVPSTHGPYSVITGEADDTLFDLSLPGQALRGHIGPVTSLCLTNSCLYSGSWDYTVRCWRRGSWDCISVLKYQDWVWCVVARGGLLLVASGPEVHVHDLPTGKLVRKLQNLHEGSVSCVEGTHSGQMLFSGGADGLLMAHDLRMKESSRVLWHHNAGVHGLGLEDPWLLSAASDGTVVMHNYEAALPNNIGKSSSTNGIGSSAPSRRTLHAPGVGPLYCVDMADSWLAAGGELPAVHTWDFTKAAEAAARAAAAKAARNSAKQAAKQRRAAAAAARAGENTDSSTHRTGKRVGDNGAGSKKGKGGSSNLGRGNSSGAQATSAAGAAACGPSAAGSSTAAAAGSAAANGNGNSSNKPRGLLAAAAAAAAAARAAEAPTLAPAGANNMDRHHHMQHARSQQQQQQQQQQRQYHGSSAQQHGGRSLHEHGSSPQWHWTAYRSSPHQHWHGTPAQQHHHWHGQYGSSPQQQRTGTSPSSRWQFHEGWSNTHKQTQSQQQRGGNGAANSSNSNRMAQECSSTTGIPIPIGARGSGSGSSKQSARRQSVGGSSTAANTPPARGAGSSTVALSSSPGCDVDRAASPHSVGAAGYRVPYSSSYPAAGQPSPWLVGSSPRFEVVLRRGGGAEKQAAESGEDGSSDAAATLATDVSAPGSLSN